MQEVNALHHRFLENISKQLKSGTRLCLAVPTWRGKYEFLHLSALDYLEDLGYNRVKFTHVADKDLIYHREGQVVGRELLVLEKR
jgi:tRNA G10  N-methylase Trm11